MLCWNLFMKSAVGFELGKKKYIEGKVAPISDIFKQLFENNNCRHQRHSNRDRQIRMPLERRQNPTIIPSYNGHWQEVWPDLAKFCHFGKKCTSPSQMFDSLFLIWQNAEPTLANLWHYLANFHCCKWPHFEKYSNHLVTLSECVGGDEFWLQTKMCVTHSLDHLLGSKCFLTCGGVGTY